MDNICTIISDAVEWISLAREVPVVFADTDLTMDIHTQLRPLLEFIFVQEGNISFRVKDLTATLRQGDVAIVNAHFGNHGELDEDSSRYACVSFDVRKKKDFRWMDGSPLLHIVRVEDEAELSALYHNVSMLYHSPPRHLPAVQLKASLLRLLSMIYEHSLSATPRKTNRNRHVRKALRILREQHANPNLTLTKLAREVHLSVDHLGRVFKKEMGISPIAYVLHLRISRARSLLLHTDLAVKQIAYVTGFRDPLYFSRIFRRETGDSPSAFRERHPSIPMDPEI